MRVLIDCSSLQVGGGIQVAVSFLNDLVTLELKEEICVLLSPQVSKIIDKTRFDRNFQFYDLQLKDYRNLFFRIRAIKRVEAEFNPSVIFVIFGPSYHKSKVQKIVGYAIPHYLYEDSPFFDKISIKQKVRLFFLKVLQISLFKRNSDILVFETEDARKLFCSKYNFACEKTYVVSNSVNQIFHKKSLCKNTYYNFQTSNAILCLSANYPHKNLAIIPQVIDSLVNNYKFLDFKFVISLSKKDLKFDSKYDKYIDYIGKVSIDELPALYQSVSVLFMPTLLEVFSTTYLEAMHMHVPIVTSNLSFARDVCGNAAEFFDPQNPNDCANKIRMLLEDNNLKLTLIESGKINLSRFGTSLDRTQKYLKIIINNS